MTSTLDQLRNKKAEIEAIASRYGLSNVRVFGSVLYGEDHPNSDIDFVVSLPQAPQKGEWGGFWRLDSFGEEVKSLLKRDIDVVPDEYLKSAIKTSVLEEALTLNALKKKKRSKPLDKDKLHVLYILEQIAFIEEILKGNSAVVENDKLIQSATFHALQTLSESITKLSDEAKASLSIMPYDKIRGFRNLLAHEYLGKVIDLKKVRQVIDVELPTIKREIKRYAGDKGYE